MKSVVRFKRTTRARWEAINPVLSEGEAGYETDTGQLKVGDGVTPYLGLAYTGTGSISLAGHVNSPAPHPVYDDAPSLLLLYENAKV